MSGEKRWTAKTRGEARTASGSIGRSAALPLTATAALRFAPCRFPGNSTCRPAGAFCSLFSVLCSLFSVLRSLGRVSAPSHRPLLRWCNPPSHRHRRRAADWLIGRQKRPTTTQAGAARSRTGQKMAPGFSKVGGPIGGGLAPVSLWCRSTTRLLRHSPIPECLSCVLPRGSF